MATWHFDENTADTLPAAINVSSDPPPSEHEALGPAAENQVQEEMVPNSLEEKANTGDNSKKGAGGGSGLNALTGWSSEPKAGGYAEDGTVDLRGNPVLKSKTGNWKACPFILGNECCERLAYYGIAINLVVYLQTKLHQESATAANNVTNWSGTCYIAPLIGGFFADAFLGRYWTIASFSTIYFVGMLLLTLSASLPSLRPKHANENATSGELAMFYLALYLIALGTGGIKPCVSSFGADQFDDNDPKEKKRKTSFFNWFYFSINIGALIASSVLVWIQTNIGWGWGFGIPTVAMGLAIGTFFFGTSLYRHQKPGGSPLTRIIQVLYAAIRKWRVPAGKDHATLYELQDNESGIEGSRMLEHTPAFQFLDKAATLTTSDKVKGVQPSPWQLCSITQVEEVKIIIRLLPIWASSIVFATVYAQMSTLFVEQGTVMNVSMGPNFNIPAASLSIFDTLSVIVCVPLYDRILVPIVRRRTGNVRGFKQLHRMGIGLVVSTLSMVAAAIVEIERLKSAKHHNLLGTNAQEDPLPVPISIFWQIPQYFLIGASEVFTFIGQLEFFYDQAPDAMRSLSSALSLTTVALGNYLSTVIVTVVTRISTKNGKPGWIPNNLNRGHLDYFFWTLAVLSVLNIGFYLACAHWYQYKRVNNASTVAPDPATKTTVVADSQQL